MGGPTFLPEPRAGRAARIARTGAGSASGDEGDDERAPAWLSP